MYRFPPLLHLLLLIITTTSHVSGSGLSIGSRTLLRKLDDGGGGNDVAVDLNDWLDKESSRTGLSKSAIVMMAVENYRREKEAIGAMADMGQLVAKIEQLEKAAERNVLE